MQQCGRWVLCLGQYYELLTRTKVRTYLHRTHPSPA